MVRTDNDKKGTVGTILFYGTPAYGHINPTLPIVCELVKNGYQVVYYATEEFRQAIEATGAEFHLYDFSDTGWTPQVGSRILELTELVLKFTDEQIERLLKQAEEWKPVLILHDTIAFWGRAIASVLKIKAVSVNTIVTAYNYTGKAFRLYLSRFSWTCLSEFRVLPSICRYRRRLQKRYPIPKMNLLNLLMNKEELNLFTYPGFIHPEESKLKEGYFFLGPSAIMRQVSSEQDENYQYDNLIYVSLGTVFNESLHFFRTVMDEFANTKYQVMISCGKQYDVLIKEQIPDNIILKRYVNQNAVMKNAIVFITAGGMNSICEAASCGVPCLIYPQQGEQDINSIYFERNGLGNRIKSEHNLLQKTEKLLNGFQPNADLIREFNTIHMEELMIKIKQYIGITE